MKFEDDNINKSHINILSRKKVKKDYIIHPLSEDITDYNNYKDKTDKIFNDPNFFFTTKHNGNEIIIGKKLTKIKFHNHIPLLQTKIQRKSLQMKNHQFKCPSVKSSSGISSSSKLNSHNHNISHLKINQKFIEQEDLKRIYDTFKKIELDNFPFSISSKKILKNENYKIKNKLFPKFILQEKTLHNHLSENKSKDKLILKIQKKTKKKKTDILINSVDTYRIKKEFIDHIEEEMKKTNPNEKFGWLTSLRYSEKGDLKYYVNIGGKNPNWQLYPLKPIENNQEIIRNPSFDKGIYNSKSLKCYFDNKYLEKKFPKSYSYIKSWYNNNKREIKKIYSRNNKDNILFDGNENKSDIQNLCVKGENLLSFELENSKLLKGKKILNTSHYNLDEKKSYLISEYIDSPMIKSSFSNPNLFSK